ncbi:TapY2 family type IVa secretion system protein [Shewanella maritima]|uniref:TapY2 family type IVa secretion system protein n=1 Tax=Shewanella maritima TaxID=2520507 RepID=UPI003735765A
MIKISFSLCLLFIITSNPALAVAGKQDYKCFITSSNKGDEVVFYRWDIGKVEQQRKGLIGKKHKDLKGKKSYIKAVGECVPLSADFSSEKAQAVDKMTLR